MSSIIIKRRELLAGCGALVLMTGRALAAPLVPRRLSLANAHTGETFSGPYRDAAGPIPAAITDLAKFLRDHHSNKEGPVCVETLDLLADLLDGVRQNKATILSAYRTPETNQMLMKQGLGVAEHSQHLLGRALDITLDSRLPEAHMRALEMRRGGVGWYPRSFFLHIDTGPVRSWEMGGTKLLDGLFPPGVSGHVMTLQERLQLHRELAHREMLDRQHVMTLRERLQLHRELARQEMLARQGRSVVPRP